MPTTLERRRVGRHAARSRRPIYFCCSEALQNAGKHAGADATVTVRVTEDRADTACGRSSTTAPGFDAAALGGGHGFVNMQDRMGSVGGQLEVIERAGGTTVRGSIPLEPAARPARQSLERSSIGSARTVIVVRSARPKVVVMATSAASRPRPMTVRPARCWPWLRGSIVYQRSPR